MTQTLTPIPAGYHTAPPYLFVRDCARALEFYTRTFGATEKLQMPLPNGKVGHAEIKIGDSIIMLAEELFNRAINAGAMMVLPVTDLFYGDRVGTLKDPFGHVWSIATHKEDLTPTELSERMATFFKRGNV